MYQHLHREGVHNLQQPVLVSILILHASRSNSIGPITLSLDQVFKCIDTSPGWEEWEKGGEMDTSAPRKNPREISYENKLPFPFSLSP